MCHTICLVNGRISFKTPVQLLESQRVEEDGNHLDKQNAKDLDKNNSKSECGDCKKRKGLIRYYHQGSKSRKNSAVTTGEKLRRNLEEKVVEVSSGTEFGN